MAREISSAIRSRSEAGISPPIMNAELSLTVPASGSGNATGTAAGWGAGAGASAGWGGAARWGGGGGEQPTSAEANTSDATDGKGVEDMQRGWAGTCRARKGIREVRAMTW